MQRVYKTKSKKCTAENLSEEETSDFIEYKLRVCGE